MLVTREIDDRHCRTKEDEYRKQLAVVKLFGKIDYDPRYDYKQARYRPSSQGVDTPLRSRRGS